jgi:hypothetical protein
VIGTLTEMADWTQRDDGDPTTRWLRQVAASFPEVDLVALAAQYRDQRHTAPPSFNRFRALAQRTSERRAKRTATPVGRVRSARDHDFS